MNAQVLTTSVKSLQFSMRKALKSLTDFGNHGIVFKSWMAAKRFAIESLSVVYTLPWTRSKPRLHKVSAISRYAAETPSNPWGWNFWTSSIFKSKAIANIFSQQLDHPLRIESDNQFLRPIQQLEPEAYLQQRFLNTRIRVQIHQTF